MHTTLSNCRQLAPLEGNLDVLTCRCPMFGAALLVIGYSLLAWSLRASLGRGLSVAAMGRTHLQAVSPLKLCRRPEQSGIE